jgi:uncharacterized repeat protein (TIGR03803 family)
LLCAAAAVSSPAQTFTTLHTFDITDGAFPNGTLVQGLDGNFYGTTVNGGRQVCNVGCGTVFKITPQGVVATLHRFVVTDGAYPQAGLVLATNGNFYGSTTGSTLGGGVSEANSYFFAITSGGTFSNLHSGGSLAALMQAINGNLFGTEYPNYTNANEGSVFWLSPGGVLSTVHTFCALAHCLDGAIPLAPLVQAAGGYLYGTTEAGGKGQAPGCGEGCGTVFRTGSAGSTSILYNFEYTDGASPSAGLTLGNDGNLYGTTRMGGAYGYGTVFKITPTGLLTTLHNFDNTDGSFPDGALVQATDGNFYGTTVHGGNYLKNCSADGCGTIFQMIPSGALTTLHSFDRLDDGLYPFAGLVQGTDGDLYGTTTGADGYQAYGTVFKLSTGLVPFVKTVPVAAYPGKQIFILGNNLTGATSVMFGGTAASFTVVSATEITATVPAGSTTGTVVVATPGGSLSSNVPFRVF